MHRSAVSWLHHVSTARFWTEGPPGLLVRGMTRMALPMAGSHQVRAAGVYAQVCGGPRTARACARDSRNRPVRPRVNEETE